MPVALHQNNIAFFPLYFPFWGYIRTFASIKQPSVDATICSKYKSIYILLEITIMYHLKTNTFHSERGMPTNTHSAAGFLIGHSGAEMKSNYTLILSVLCLHQGY